MASIRGVKNRRFASAPQSSWGRPPTDAEKKILSSLGRAPGSWTTWPRGRRRQAERARRNGFASWSDLWMWIGNGTCRRRASLRGARSGHIALHVRRALRSMEHPVRFPAARYSLGLIRRGQRRAQPRLTRRCSPEDRCRIPAPGDADWERGTGPPVPPCTPARSAPPRGQRVQVPPQGHAPPRPASAIHPSSSARSTDSASGGGVCGRWGTMTATPLQPRPLRAEDRFSRQNSRRSRAKRAIRCCGRWRKPICDHPSRRRVPPRDRLALSGAAFYGGWAASQVPAFRLHPGRLEP